jgi:hypothetical protein
LSSVAAPISSSIPGSSSSVAAPISSSSIPAPPLPSGPAPSYGAPSTVVAVQSSAAPTTAHPAPTGGPTGPGKYPADRPIPKGFTFGDLLAWLKYTVRTVFNKGGKKHARDFTVR